MVKRDMLLLDRGLVEKIDDNRGDLSRAEFIEFCIDTCLGVEEPEKVEKYPEQEFAPRQKEMPIYATREEFQEFRRGMRELLRAFLDFFITFGLELGTGKSMKGGLEDIKTQLRATLEDS